MAKLNLSDTVDERTTELRSLRRLITAPTQRVVDELVRHVRKLNADLYTPEELTKLLVPIINEALHKRIAAGEQQVTATLAPLIDKIFTERTLQDKTAIVNALAPTVAKALRDRHEKFPNEVAEDLAPLMSAAIRKQVRARRAAMVDALYPIIGSAMTKYMAETLRQLVENVNKKIGSLFSPGGLRRKATGVSEAELIPGKSLPFTVEAVLLIHKASGSLISGARRGDAESDVDVVSGRLTGIRSFVNEWITRSGHLSGIAPIEYGRSNIMLEVAGHCSLAVVSEGEPPQEFAQRVRDTFARIVDESDREIAAFQGELSFIPMTVHERVRSLMEAAPGGPSGAVAKKSFVRTMLPLAGILVLLIGPPLGWHFYRQDQDRQSEARISSAVASLLGFSTNPIMVQVDGDAVRLRGTLPNALLKERVLTAVRASSLSTNVEDGITIRDAPTHPAITAAEVERITAAFNTLDGVSVSSTYTDGNVTLRGTVTDRALGQKIVAEIERLPGISSLSYSFKNRMPTIDEVIYFLRSNEFTEDAPPKLQKIHDLLAQFPSVNLRIIGYTDAVGTTARNLPLSLARAVAVRDALVELGVAENRMQVDGEGKPAPGIDPALSENRCVRFETFESPSPSDR